LSTLPQNQPTTTASDSVDRNAAEANPSGLERLVFFSDAVFAIAITLLALEIRPPEGVDSLNNEQLLQALLTLGSSYYGYILSFLVIGSFWIGHHRRFLYIQRYDNRLIYLNLVFLMLVAFMPFPSAILTRSGNQTATLFYALIITAQSLIFTLMWWYASWKGRLINPDLDVSLIRREQTHSLMMSGVFLLSIVIVLFDHQLARLMWFLLIPISMARR
jgi:uncharacterized membrane protein